MHAQSIQSADVELIEQGDRLFLEATRFDRIGLHGRSSMISLQMVDAEFVGDGADWPIVMQQLADQKLVSEQDVQHARFIWEFGYLINNTDMHLGNLSLAMSGAQFSMLPTYDMCSMGFAPVGGEVRPLAFSLAQTHSRFHCLREDEHAQQLARKTAIDFWDRVAADERISDELRRFLMRGNPVELCS